MECPVFANLGDRREYRLLFVSGLLGSFGAQILSIALPLFVLRTTGSAARAGLVGAVSMAAVLVTMLPGGLAADTIERRRLMRLCDVGSLVAVGALVVAAVRETAPLPLVLLASAVGAVISCFYWPAALGLLRAVVPSSGIAAATSRLQARGAVARLAGPVVGGALFSWRPAAPFVAVAVALLLSTLALAFMRTRSRPTRSGPVLGREQLVAGLSFLWHQPYLRTVLLVFGVGMNAAFSAMMFASLAIASRGGQSGLNGGLIVSLLAVGSLTGALLGPRLKAERNAAAYILGTCWVCAISVGLLALVHPPLVIGAFGALCTATAAVANIGFLTSLLAATPESMVGRVQSAAGLLSSLAQPAGPLVAGLLLTAWGPSATYAVLGAGFAVCAAVLSLAPSARPALLAEAVGTPVPRT
jgi:MFS family permease